MNVRRGTATLQATCRDVLDAPHGMVAEIVRGALHLQPRPASPPGFAGFSLGGELGGPFQKGRGGPGGWWFAFEPELHLGPEVVVPDLAGWRRERMPRFPRAPFLTQSPDWVCEILSPATRRVDLGPKRDIYGEHGMGWLWFVDPDARTLEAFARRDGAWVLLGTATGDDAVRLAPFDAVGFSLGVLWPDEDEPPGDRTPDDGAA